MKVKPQCPECGGALVAEHLEGLCPACAMRAALGRGDARPLGNCLPDPLLPPGFISGSRAGLEVFGDYELLSEIARGGMGVVYRARQLSLNRVVALKMILGGRYARESEVKRFRAEAEAAARLQHPNIVAIHEVGEHGGQPYFSMDLVEGDNLGQRVRERPLSPILAAGYLKKISEAIGYAHAQGVVHRDLKPSNVLIDWQGEPRLTDFGLAKQLESDSDLTISGQVLGSPNFMAPEQAAGRRSEVGPRSDIYSLGAILYFCMTGRPPFAGESLGGLLAQVIESEPVSPRALNQALPPDLETICLKCLDKSRTRRYQTALELAEELGRFMRGEPILARPVGSVERSWRWCRRNRALAGLVGLAVVLLLASAVGSSLSALRIAQARNAEKAQRILAESREAEGEARLARLKIAEGSRLAERGEWLDALVPFSDALRLEAGRKGPEAANRARIAFLLENGPQLRRVWHASGPLTHLELSSDGNSVLSATATHEGRTDQAAAQVWDVRSGEPLTAPMLHAGRISFAGFSRDGRRIVTASEDRTARVWDASTGQPLGPPMRHNVGVVHAAWSPDGRQVATCTPSWPLDTNGHAFVWNVSNGAAVYTNQTFGMDAQFVQFSPSGRQLWIGSRTYLCELHDIESGQRVGYVPAGWSIGGLVYSPDGSRLLAAGTFGGNWEPGARLFDASTFEAITALLPHAEGPVLAGAFSPDGRTVVTAGSDQCARLWDALTGQAVGQVLKHSGPVVGAVFSRDSRVVLTASRDGTARLWEANTGLALGPALNHGGPVCGAVFVAGDAAVLTGSEDGALRVWDPWPAAGTQRLLLARGEVRCAGFSPDGRWLATGDSGGVVQLWEVATFQPAFPPALHSSAVTLLKFSGDSRRLLVACEDISVRVWGVGEGQLKSLGRIMGQGGDLSMDGQRVAAALFDRLASVCDAETGKPHARALSELVPDAPVELAHKVHFSPDGRRLALPHDSGNVSLWNGVTLQPLTVIRAHTAPVLDLAFSADSRVMVTFSEDNTASLWNGESGAPIGGPLRHVAPVRSAAFDAAGSRVVTASDDGTARLWSCRGGQALAAPMVHRGSVVGVCFSPDGRWVATASSDHTARIWDAQTGEAITPPLTHAGRVRIVEFSPDGGWLMSAGDDQTARLWRLPAEDRTNEELCLEAALLAAVPASAGTVLGPGRTDVRAAFGGLKAATRGRRRGSPAAVARERTHTAWRLAAVEAAETQGDDRKLIRALTLLLECDANQWNWLYRRGLAHSRRGDAVAAVKDYTRALELEPYAASCWVRRYVARAGLGDAAAGADLRTALERARAWRTHGSTTGTAEPCDPSLRSQWEAIIGDCTAGLRADPTAAVLLCARGVAEAAQFRGSLATLDFEAAARLQPAQLGPWLALAMLSRDKASRLATAWPQAYEAAREAKARAPNDAAIASLYEEAVRNLALLKSNPDAGNP